MRYIILSCIIIVCLAASSCTKKVRVCNKDEQAIPVRMVGDTSTMNTPPPPPPPTERHATDYMLIIQPDSSIVAYVRTQVQMGWEPLGGIVAYGKNQYAQAMVKY